MANMKNKKLQRKCIRIGIIVCVFVVLFVGLCIYIGMTNKEEVENEAWAEITLESDVETENRSKDSIVKMRATYYDYYSDSQLFADGVLKREPAKITDGLEEKTNAFQRFNALMADYTNSAGISYASLWDPLDGSSLWNPLYCGTFFKGQTIENRWGDGEKSDEEYGWTEGTNTDSYSAVSQYNSDGTLANGSFGAVTQGLVSSKLNGDGNLMIGAGDKSRVLPMVDKEFLAQPLSQGTSSVGSVLENMTFPLRKGNSYNKINLGEKREVEDPEYLYFDSSKDVVQVNSQKQKVTFYSGDDQYYVRDANGMTGFFPLSVQGDSEKESLNYGFAMKSEFSFHLPVSGKEQKEDIIFEVAASGDLWVFVDGVLALDMGGVHKTSHGCINFAQSTATVNCVQSVDNNGNYVYGKSVLDFGENAKSKDEIPLRDVFKDPAQEHIITMYYIQRSQKSGSVLKIKTNLPKTSSFSIADELDYSEVNPAFQTDDLWKACGNYYFKYEIESMASPKNDEEVDLREDKIIRSNLTPIGLDETYREKASDNAEVQQRVRFYTVFDKNYCGVVSTGTKIDMPRLDEDNRETNVKGFVDSENCYQYKGEKYIFLGWTTDSYYKKNCRQVLDDTYVGFIPEIVSDVGYTVNVDTDFYAVWMKKSITVCYYDEIDNDQPIGYEVQEEKGSDGLALIGKEVIRRDAQTVSTKLWTDADMKVASTAVTLQRKEWKTNETRKGFELVGWSDKRLTEDARNVYNAESISMVPLCDVKLYAEWDRLAYRMIFSMPNIEEKGVGRWTSGIVYVSRDFVGYLPYIRYDSWANDFIQRREGIDCFDFEGMELPSAYLYPQMKGYGILHWAIKNDSKKYYVTKDKRIDGTSYDKTIWKAPDEDVYLTGCWEKLYEGEEYSTVHKSNTQKIVYEFSDKTIGILGENHNKKHAVSRYLTNDSELQLPVLEDFGSDAPYDKVGTNSGKTNFVMVNGKAFAITGWSTDSGRKNKIQPGQKVTKACTLYAVWEEVFSDLTIYVKVDDLEEEWNVSKAIEHGWKYSNEQWEYHCKLIPGHTFGSYFSKKGSLYEDMYAGDYENDLNHYYELKYYTLLHGNGNQGIDLPGLRVPYSATEPQVFLVGSWEQTDVLVTFYRTTADNDIKKAVPVGYQLYQIGTRTALPGKNSKLLDSKGKAVLNIGGITGYKLEGWTIYDEKDALVSLMPEKRMHGLALYMVWEKEVLNSEIAKDKTKQQKSATQTPQDTVEATKKNGLADAIMQVQKKTVDNMTNLLSDYSLVNSGTYTLFDLHQKGEWSSCKLSTNNGIVLTYDQSASLVDFFEENTYLHVSQDNYVYDSNGMVKDEKPMQLFDTTWELRDVHGVVTDQVTEKELSNVKNEVKGKSVVYDGRVEDEQEGAILFANENADVDLYHGANLQVLFTHKIRTSNLVISRENTGGTKIDYYQLVTSQIFGDKSVGDTIYCGTYCKKNRLGEYISDGMGNIVYYKAEDGIIGLAPGESAVIEGIPVMTSYTIKKEGVSVIKNQVREANMTYKCNVSLRNQETTGVMPKDTVSVANKIEEKEQKRKYERLHSDKYISVIQDEYETEALEGEVIAFQQRELQAVTMDGVHTTVPGSKMIWYIDEAKSDKKAAKKCRVIGTTFVAGDVEGDVYVKAKYQDNRRIKPVYGEGYKIHVVKAYQYNLYVDEDRNQFGNENPQQVSSVRSSSSNGKSTSIAVDGDKENMWVSGTNYYSADTYYAILFHSNANRIDETITERVVSSVLLTMQSRPCVRTIELYGLTENVVTENDGHELQSSVSVYLGSKQIGENESELRFDFPPGCYKGVKIVYRDTTDTRVYPSLIELEVFGR